MRGDIDGKISEICELVNGGTNYPVGEMKDLARDLFNHYRWGGDSEEAEEKLSRFGKYERRCFEEIYLAMLKS